MPPSDHPTASPDCIPTLFCPDDAHAETEARIASWFCDHPDAPYSVHNIAQLGERKGKPVGNWFSPTLTALVCLGTGVGECMGVHLSVGVGVCVQSCTCVFMGHTANTLVCACARTRARVCVHVTDAAALTDARAIPPKRASRFCNRCLVYWSTVRLAGKCASQGQCVCFMGLAFVIAASGFALSGRARDGDHGWDPSVTITVGPSGPRQRNSPRRAPGAEGIGPWMLGATGARPH